MTDRFNSLPIGLTKAQEKVEQEFVDAFLESCRKLPLDQLGDIIVRGLADHPDASEATLHDIGNRISRAADEIGRRDSE